MEGWKGARGRVAEILMGYMGEGGGGLARGGIAERRGVGMGCLTSKRERLAGIVEGCYRTV